MLRRSARKVVNLAGPGETQNVQFCLPLDTHERWTAKDLAHEINKRRPTRTKRWYVPVRRVSSMLKAYAARGRIEVKRRLDENRLVVWYEGPCQSFDEIKRRA